MLCSRPSFQWCWPCPLIGPGKLLLLLLLLRFAEDSCAAAIREQGTGQPVGHGLCWPERLRWAAQRAQRPLQVGKLILLQVHACKVPYDA